MLDPLTYVSGDSSQSEYMLNVLNQRCYGQTRNLDRTELLVAKFSEGRESEWANKNKHGGGEA